jgi:F-type H+-transporting ATPase subunit epsilon
MILEIVSPEATLFSGEITSVTLPGIDGSFQILNNHAPIVSILKNGNVKVVTNNLTENLNEKINRVDNTTFTLAINSGTIEMNNNKVIVLVD